jgi:hypothetical protein
VTFGILVLSCSEGRGGRTGDHEMDKYLESPHPYSGSCDVTDTST